MTKFLVATFLMLMLASVAWSQESEKTGDTTAIESQSAETPAADAQDDADLDEQGYEKEDEDDFVPSEEVSADQTLPFPTDI